MDSSDADSYDALPARIDALTTPAQYASESDDVRAAIYAAAGRFIQGCKAWMEAVRAKHRPNIEEAHAYHKALVAAENADMEAPKRAEVRLKILFAQYSAIEEDKRRQREVALALEMQKAAEDAALVVAAALDAAGDAEAAAAVVAAPVVAPTPIVPKAKVEGVSTRQVWRWRLRNAAALKPQFLLPHDKAITALVTKLGPQADSAVGKGAIEVYPERIVSARRA